MRTSSFTSLATKSFFLLLGAELILSCGAYEQLHRQTPTFANMQNISRNIEVVVSEKGHITESAAMNIIAEYNEGQDGWGTPYIFKSRNQPEFSYIVVSLGSDRVLDVGNIDAYFELAETDIVGQFARDIVFRDGKYVTIASAK